MKKRLLSAVMAFFLLCSPVLAATVPGKDGNGATKYWQTNGDGSSGNPYVQHMILSDGVNTAAMQTAGADAGSNTASRLAVSSWLQGFNGTTWDRVRTGLTSAASSMTGYLNVLPFAQYNSTPPSLTNGQSVLLQVNASGALKVDGTFWQATQPISAASLPLPSGAATSARQPAIGTAGSPSSDILTVQGIAGMMAIKVDGSAATQPVTGTVTANIGTSGNLALDATLTGGSQKAIVRGGAKGSTSAADVTSTASGSNHQPLDVVIYDTSGNAITSFGGSGGTSSSFGSAFPSSGTAIGASDGTNMQALKVDGSNNLLVKINAGGATQPISATSLPLPSGAATAAKQPALGTAGSASTDVITVQGIASMTALKVDGSAVTQPVSDGGGSLTVDGTVTASLSSSTNAGATAKTLDYDSGAGTDTVTGFGVLLPKSGGAVAGGTSSDPLRIDPTGTTAQPVTDNGGSLTVDGSVSIGSALPAGTNNIGDVDLASAIPAGTNYIGKIRLTDGTNDVTLKSLTNAKAVPTAIVDGNGDQITSFGGGTQYTEGDTDSTITGTALLWEDTSDTLQAVSASKPLPVNIISGAGSGGTAQADKSAFTEGTTSLTPAGGVYNETISADPSEDQAAAVRITAKRAIHTNLRNASGTEIGTSSNPLRVDPTGTTTQPVSDAGGSLTVDGTVTVQDGGNVLSVDDAGGSLTVDGTVTASLSSSTNAGATAKTLDYDSVAGTDTVTGFGILLPKSGGAVAGGTSSDPVRIDPTGTTTQPISAASLPLPSGAATAAKQPALGTAGSASSDVITVQGIASMTALKVDGSAVTQPVSISGNQAVNVAQVNGSTVSTAASGVQKVGLVGNAGATVDSAIGAGTAPTNQVVVGQIYNTTAPAPTNGQAMAMQSDQAGNHLVAPGIATATLSAWNSGTSLNATQTIFTHAGVPAVLVQLTQTTTLSAGAVTFEVTFDNSNWSTISADAVIDPTSTTQATISLPYTVQASTNKTFLLLMKGAQGLRAKLSTQITGSGTVTPNYALIAYPGVQQTILGAGSATIGSLAANQSVNVAQLAGTTTDTNSGSKSAGTLRVVLATDQPQLTNKLLVTPDANSAINLAQVGGNSVNTGTGNAGTGTARVVLASDQPVVATGGNVAHDGVDSGNPVKQGFKAINAEVTAVANADRVDGVADLTGKQIVLPYANPENFIAGKTSDITGTSDTAVIAAQGSGVRIYVTQITVTNSHASTGTWVNIKDGSTTIYTGYAAAAGGGFTITFPVPLRLTANTALNAANETTSSNTRVSASGYKGS